MSNDETHNERIYLRALYMCAAHCQGGHSEAGREAAMVLCIGFPVTMEGLEYAAKRDGFDVDELWPWLAKQRGEAAVRAADEVRAKEIFESWRDHPQWVPWLDGGNSLMQDKARSIARAERTERLAKDTSAPGSVVTPRQVLCSELGMSSAEADNVIANLAAYGFCIQKAEG